MLPHHTHTALGHHVHTQCTHIAETHKACLKDAHNNTSKALFLYKREKLAKGNAGTTDSLQDKAVLGGEVVTQGSGGDVAVLHTLHQWH